MALGAKMYENVNPENASSDAGNNTESTTNSSDNVSDAEYEEK